MLKIISITIDSIDQGALTSNKLTNVFEIQHGYENPEGLEGATPF